MKLDLEKEFPQPGLDHLRRVVVPATDSPQTATLLHHLDSQNYTYISQVVAKNSAGAPAQQAQNFTTLLPVAVQLTVIQNPEIDPSHADTVSQTLNDLSPKEQVQLYADFTQEFASDQDTNPTNYQLPTGETNPFLDYLYQYARSQTESQLGQIWSNFTSPAAPETEATAATAGGVAAAVVASKISLGTALVPVSTSTLAGAATALPPAQILGFGINSDLASSVIGQEYLSFGVFQSVSGEAVASTLGTAAQPGTSYFALTPKGLRLATTNPKIANVVKYVSSSPGVTTVSASGATTSGATTSAAAKTAVGTAAKGAAQVATRAATQTAVSAAGAEAGAAVGSGVLPILGTIIGAVVGFVLGAVVGNWSKVKHDAQEGLLATFALGATLFHSTATFTIGAFTAILAAIGSVAVASVGAIVVIALATPIVIAFFLYIITNSAYIVPPSSMVFVPGGGGGGGGGFENRSSCPLADGYIGTFSYNPASETGHGSNQYWNVPNTVCNTTNACFLNIPANGNSKGPIGSSAAANCCYQLFNCSNPSSPGCTPFYGYAIDIYSRAGSAAYNPVYFPLINGKITTWNYTGGVAMPPNRGKAYLYTTTDPDTGTRYDVVFMHLIALASPPSGLQSGQSWAQVYPATIFRPHVHLELQINGVYVKPEGYFCS